ncbi:prolyl endopeptidase [Polistes fuscatus]|uniref:prolyl endopeptidase n=1 Tax=Polistes fuscatus TaxID=30207 RepID=UPI001CAA204F|nr:prolyl endopeptidase [Polistes fuscatus]
MAGVGASFYLVVNSFQRQLFRCAVGIDKKLVKKTLNFTHLRQFHISSFSKIPQASYNRGSRNKFKTTTMSKLEYPVTRRDETVVENYHGIEITDPYRWLEDPNSEETKLFIDAQNALTKPYLASCKSRQDIHDRLKQLWDFPKYMCPAKHGNRYYFYKNTGLQNQSVLYVQDTLDSEPRVFLDPNTLSEDGTVAISFSRFSEDGSIFAYGLSSSGSDWNTIHFINANTGEKYPEVLERVKFSPLTWTHDNVGVFYGHYRDQKGKVDGLETQDDQNQKLCYHRVGTPQSEDVIVVEFPEEPLWRIGAQVSDCGKWLIVTPVKDCRDNLVYFTELKADSKIDGLLPLTQVVDKLEADYEYMTNVGTKAIFRTNKNASNFKLIAIDLLDYKEDKWTDLLPEHPDNVLDWASAVDGDKFVACYIQDVKNILQLHSLTTGKLLRTFPLDVGTIIGFSGDKKYSEIFYQFTSFLTPGIIYTADLKNDDEPKIFREIKVKNFDSSLYKTLQVFYTSKDGTQIPMFIVMKSDAVLDNSMPALLNGYGGFNVSIQPVFSVTRLVFVQHLNGVLAIPNIRGGGEYGEKWHNGGRLFNKQNVFDDFQCAAEYLIDNGYTTPSKLTIQGGSNGGLLVAACINQRPSLFGAAIAQVGVMDMLRFHKFTIGSAWVSDYGSSEDPKHFENLIKYSPLHNVKIPEDGSQYPATLLLTADHDDRVVPLHSLKLIATLQYVLGNVPNQTNPLLARIETKAGHGGGKPTTKVIEENTDILSFIVQALNLKFKL